MEYLERAASLLGDEAVDRLQRSHVAVFGLGGVGSWCAEALARSGVGTLTLIDEDTVSESNINRQLCAGLNTLGKPKAEVLARRLSETVPGITVYPLQKHYCAETREEFFVEPYSFAADCIDLVSCKLDLIETCLARDIPIISALGTGNKKDASLLRITDISKTEGCPFARIIRKELRARGIQRLPVVFSPEQACECEQRSAPPPGRRSVPGSLVWVPASAGMLMAQHIVLSLCGNEKEI